MSSKFEALKALGLKSVLMGQRCSVMANSKNIFLLSLHSEKLNLFNKAFVHDLKGALHTIEHSDPAVVIIKSDIPGVFSAGADLKERLRLNIRQTRAFVHSLRSLFLRISNIKVPTLSCIEGCALGGGLELALMTDIRICNNVSSFGLPETKLAVIPGAGGTQTLPETIGYARASEMIFTGRIIDANEASRIGLVNQSLSQDKLLHCGLQIAQNIASSGPVAVRAAKSAMKSSFSIRDKGMASEFACYERVLRSHDRLEALEAFAAKRTPTYTGT